MKIRTELEQQLFEALTEMTSLFDNYPETLEMVGTYQIAMAALDKTARTTSANESLKLKHLQ